MKLHHLLLRQLKKLNLGDISTPPNVESWPKFLEKINNAYQEADNDRYLLERSLDISSKEIKERWESMQILEERWRTLVACAPDIIMILDSEGLIQFTNRAIGAIPENSSDKNIYTYIQLKDRAKIFEKLRLVFSNSESSECEIQCINGVDANKLYAMRLAPFIFESKIVGAILVATDRSDKVRMEKEIEQSAQTIQSVKMATLGEMAASIGHEINNPLAIVRLHAEQLRDMAHENSVDIKNLEKLSNKIEEMTIRISKIVSSIKNFSRDDSQDPMKLVSLQEIVDSVLELCSQKFKVSGVELTISIEPKNILLNCRSVQFSQVILNLLGNAYDALISQAIEKKWVKLSAKIEENWILISVTDAGGGIPTDIQNKIMNPFFTTKEAGKGTGLGLSISKNIVEQHGGIIRIDQACKNTKFEIRLPNTLAAALPKAS